MMTTLLIATRNQHKVGEIQSILGSTFVCCSLEDFPGAPAVVEDAATFAGNALKKARSLARWLTTQASAATTEFVLADDSGLAVDALGGAPGVHSARFAALDAQNGANTPDAENNAKLLRLLAGLPIEKRTGRFHCAIVLVRRSSQNEDAVTFEGRCEGRIEFAPRGIGGFGYDPLFIPDGFTESFAELGEDVKNRLSHRAQALGKLRTWLTARAG
jgi:XTP/dITP diphosphohydrolase